MFGLFKYYCLIMSVSALRLASFGVIVPCSLWLFCADVIVLWGRLVFYVPIISFESHCFTFWSLVVLCCLVGTCFVVIVVWLSL